VLEKRKGKKKKKEGPVATDSPPSLQISPATPRGRESSPRFTEHGPTSSHDFPSNFIHRTREEGKGKKTMKEKKKKKEPAAPQKRPGGPD